MKATVSLVTALLAVVLLSLHAAGSFNGWYGEYANFDRYMHFLGGAFTFSVLMLYAQRSESRLFSYRALLALSIAVGVLWEGYEYLVQHYTGAALANIPDSIDDLVLDFIGALAAAMLFSFVQHRKKRYNTFNAG